MEIFDLGPRVSVKNVGDYINLWDNKTFRRQYEIKDCKGRHSSLIIEAPMYMCSLTLNYE